jgi:hypothetical protein
MAVPKQLLGPNKIFLVISNKNIYPADKFLAVKIYRMCGVTLVL